MNKLHFVWCAAFLAGSAFAADVDVISESVAIDVPAGETNVCRLVSGADELTITKTGAGVLELRRVENAKAKLAIEGGRVLFANPRPAVCAEAFFAVNADDPSTLDIEEVGGVTYVDKVRDANGGEVYAVNNTTATERRTTPENRRVYLQKDFLNGRTVIDYGFLLVHAFTDPGALSKAYGGALIWSKRTTEVRNVVQVIADRPEVYEACSTYGLAPRTHVGPAMICDSRAYAGRRYLLETSGAALWYDNGQNAALYGTGADTRIDGVSISGTANWHKNVHYPAGFHRLDAQTTANVGSDGFGHHYKNGSGDLSDPYGGQMLAEYYCFTNVLAEADRVALDRYLAIRWSTNRLASVTLAAGAAIEVADDVRAYADAFVANGLVEVAGKGGLWVRTSAGDYRKERVRDTTVFVVPEDAPKGLEAVTFEGDGELAFTADSRHLLETLAANGSFTKSGPGELAASELGADVSSLVVAGGTLTIDALITQKTAAHFDASATNTMELVCENGTNYVTRWDDSGATSVFATDDTTVNDYRTDAKRRTPYLDTTVTATGLPVVDLGYFLQGDYVTEEAKAAAHGGAMWWSEEVSAQEVLMVVADRPELKTIVAADSGAAGKTGPSWFAHNKNYFMRRGSLAENAYPKYGAWNSQNYDFGAEGATLVDGEAPLYYGAAKDAVFKVAPTEGFHLVDFRFCDYDDFPTPKSDSVDRFGHTGYDSKSWGGLRFGEYMVFGTRLGDTDRERFTKALRLKWFGEGERETRTLENVTVADGATLSQAYCNLSATDTLALGGRLECPEVAAANLRVTGVASASGALTLGDEPTIEFVQKADGTFGTLAVGALAIPAGATVRLVVSDVSALRGQSFKLVDSDAVTGSGWTVETSPAVRYIPRLRIAADGLYVDFGAPGMMLIFR